MKAILINLKGFSRARHEDSDEMFDDFVTEVELNKNKLNEQLPKLLECLVWERFQTEGSVAMSSRYDYVVVDENGWAENTGVERVASMSQLYPGKLAGNIVLMRFGNTDTAFKREDIIRLFNTGSFIVVREVLGTVH